MQVTDQINNSVSIPDTPRRIISLVPSITELLFDLELDRKVAGRTQFCIYPAEKIEKVPIVGGVMGLSFHQIEKINPDLILASKEENAQGEINELSSRFPVWVSDVHNLPDALELIHKIGTVCGVENKAATLTGQIKEQFHTLDHIPENIVKAVYLIWKNPMYTVNQSTFAHDMLKRCGIENVFASRQEAYPVINEKEIRNKKPDYILLPSEPYPFNEKDEQTLDKNLPEVGIKRVDGEYFTWYGSHLLNAPAYFKQLF
ncbi:MAG: helical backbone metal receptor [Bacteroidales bacterium]|nr:helical backbone metal receptor [Bacteroidales bacterium]